MKIMYKYIYCNYNESLDMDCNLIISIYNFMI